MSIFDHIEGFFGELNMASVAVRLILATLLGSFVGMERAHKRYAAGIRTFALVCLGSALATMIGLYLGEISALGADVGRIPAQILCGIGFLGAGTIIVTERKQVKGLTTAAGLWVTATMGMAIGAGFVFAAIVCFVLIFLTTYYMYY
ncbi:MAG: MgtC/SapB family protein, partial [Oscillospiraceae bacterium]